MHAMVPLQAQGCPPRRKSGRWGFPTSHRESGRSAMSHAEITCRAAQRFGPVAPHQLLLLPHRAGVDPHPGALSKTLHRHWDNPASPSLVCVCVWQGRRWQDSPPCCLHSPLCTSGQNPFALASCRARRFGPLCCGAEEPARNCQPC